MHVLSSTARTEHTWHHFSGQSRQPQQVSRIKRAQRTGVIRIGKVKKLQIEKGISWQIELRGVGKTIKKLAVSHSKPILSIPSMT